MAEQPSFKMEFSKKNPNGIVKRKEPETKRDFVVSIAGGDIESLDKVVEQGPLVIPLPEMKAPKIHKKYLKLVHGLNKMDTEEQPNQETQGDLLMKDVPPQTNGTAGVSAPAPTDTDKSKTEDEEATEELLKEAEAIARGEFVDAPEGTELPLLLKFRNTELDKIADEEKRFRADVESRPDEANVEEYDRVPVDKFGAAMLRGMGWSEGAPIGVGKNAKVAPVVEFLQRPGYRTGLGATPLAPEPQKKKKYIKPGESREPKEPQVLADADGNLKSVRKDGEALTPLSKVGLHEGSLVGIVQGPHAGLYARVLKIFHTSNEVIVRLESSDEQVKVSKDDLTIVDIKRLGEDHPAMLLKEKMKNTENRDGKKDQNIKEKPTEAPQKKQPKTWMFPHLVVRIVSKSFVSGKYYLKKGTIIDVIDTERCTVQLQDTKKLVEVKQSMLETVVPKAGEKVMIVQGKNKGQTGEVMEKLKNDKAVVQTAVDLQMDTYDLDSICQYVGDHLDN